MGILLRFWYVFVLALVLSIVAAFGLLLFRQGEWMPGEQPQQTLRPLPPEALGPSETFREWNFMTGEVENIRFKLEAEWERLRIKEAELEQWSQNITSEMDELNTLKAELVALRQSIQQEFIIIEQGEQRNLQNLAAIYAEMKAPAAMRVLAEMDLNVVVKILSLMPEDSSARILGTMAESPDEDLVRRAARISDGMRRLR